MVPAPPALHALSLHDALPIYPGLHGGGHGDRPLVVLRVEHHRRPVGGGEGDRKSTRLNSSHVAISYAVSCTKKKNAETEAIIAANTTDNVENQATTDNV